MELFKINDTEYTIQNGKVIDDKGRTAILTHPGYGAGWSTMSYEHRKTLLYWPQLVKYILEGNNQEDLLAASKKKGTLRYGLTDLKEKYNLITDDMFTTERTPNLGGISNIVIDWMEPGKTFQVREYDGAEYVEYYDIADWETT